MEEALAAAEGLGHGTDNKCPRQIRRSCRPHAAVRRSTSVILIVIALAAAAGVAYGSYRASSETKRLEERVAVLERSNRDSASRVGQLAADREKLCVSVDSTRQKITGVVLAPGSPAPNFDLEADPLSAPDRIILTFYNWCRNMP